MTTRTTRRQVMGGAAGLVVGAAAGRAQAQSGPVTINVVDVAGNLALTQPAFELFRRRNARLVSRIVFNKASAPELPAKLRAQQDARRVDIDLVLTGTDGLSAGIAQNLWEPLFPAHAAKLPVLADVLSPNALRMQALARDQACIVSYYPSGPLLEYMPERVKQVPGTAEELLAWCKANPRRFLYARPANSGPGRTFLMGLPYLLGDRDPTDPEHGWDKTWSFLQAMGDTIEYYPSGTGAVMKELGDGSRDMVVSTTGWDINPRVLGVVPKEAKIAALKGFHWVGDAQYMAVPKGLAPERLALLTEMMSFLLTKESQAFTYDQGYFYPGPVTAGVTLDMAPQDSQEAIREFGRPEYAELIANNPVELPLDADKMVYAFRRWDEQVGTRTAK